jgi:hypothetical protein
VTEPINAAQCAGLDRLLARTPDPSAAELVAAFAGPLFDEMPTDDVVTTCGLTCWFNARRS